MFSLRADVSRDSLIVSESQKECPFWLSHSFWLSLTMRESLETSALKLNIDHRSCLLSLIKTVSSCVVQIVCVITNQGSSNPNCLNFLKDAYKVYQGVPPTYCYNAHQHSMRHKRYRHSTSLSKHVWALKDEQIGYNIQWSVLRKAKEYQNTTKSVTCAWLRS